MAEFVFNAGAVEEAEEVSSGKFETGVKKVFINDAFVIENTAFKQNELVLVVGGTSNDEFKGFKLKPFCIDEKTTYMGKEKDNAKVKIFNELGKLCGLKTAPVACKVQHFSKKADKDALRFGDLIGKEVTMALQTVIGYNPRAKTDAYALLEDVQLVQSFTKDGVTIGGDTTRLKKVETRLADFETKKYKDWVEARCPSVEDDSAEDTLSGDEDGLF